MTKREILGLAVLACGCVAVPMKDGRILTAYYAAGIPGHPGYHMGIACRDPVATRAGPAPDQKE